MKYRINIKTNQIIEDNGNLGDFFYSTDWKEADQNEIINYQLNQAKTKKLQELDIYQDSDVVKSIIINNTYRISTSRDYRRLLQDQIDRLDLKSKLTGKDVNTFIWGYRLPDSNNIVPLNYYNLIKISDFIGDVIDQNFITYQNHSNAIKNFKIIEEVLKYDFTKNYIINKNLNIAI